MKIAENFAVKLFAYRESERKKQVELNFHIVIGVRTEPVCMSEHVVGNLIQFQIYDKKTTIK